nr:DUF4277 domain-containing protein [Scytonema hofmannii]
MKIQNLDHLGIVAGIVDEIGLVEISEEGRWQMADGRRDAIW